MDAGLQVFPCEKNIRNNAGETIVTVGQVHRDLPFMENDARVGEWLADMDILLDDPQGHTRLFSTPNMPVNLQDHFVGLHASSLVRDGGTLQIGIGALGDALAHALLLRHRRTADYRAVLRALGGNAAGGRFEDGLYVSTEMFVNGMLQLMEAGIVNRRVYDNLALQQGLWKRPCYQQHRWSDSQSVSATLR